VIGDAVARQSCQFLHRHEGVCIRLDFGFLQLCLVFCTIAAAVPEPGVLTRSGVLAMIR
jgi:hypothetical protein